MTASNHTKEPWAAYKDGKREMNNVNHFIKSLAGDLVSYGHLSEDDARRIVACVNACRGISNADLEMDNAAFIRVFNERTEYQQLCHDLQRQRDELLEAIMAILNSAAPEWETESGIAEYAEAVSKARSAIASAKGGSQ